MSDGGDRRELLADKEQMQEERQANVSAEKVSQQVAAEEVSEIHKNPEFVDKLQDLGISSETYSWIEEELGVELAGGHIFGNRGDGYTESIDLLSRNTSAMAVAEATPGRLLRENPRMLAVARGVHRRVNEDEDPVEEMQAPATPKEKRGMRAASDLIANHKSKAEEGEGLDAVSTVTTERKQQTDNESESTVEESTLSFLG
jgi:hypothetical protein